MGRREHAVMGNSHEVKTLIGESTQALMRRACLSILDCLASSHASNASRMVGATVNISSFLRSCANMI
eukprot:883184-Amphidinium_carterae.1